MDISVIITAHSEGLYLNKTLLSINNALKDIKAKTEIIISLDNADNETLRIANKWKKEDDRVKLFKVSFGNPADNRNDAVKKSTGKYIMIIDGDDLISDNFIVKAYSSIKKYKKKIIFRPEVHLQFGYEEQKYTAWRMRSSTDKSTDAVQLSYWNLWTNCLFTQREVLEEIPFKNPKKGYGFEDYLFCTETIAKDIPNIIVPETILFYRRRLFSTSSLHVGTILEYSELFDINYFKNIPLPKESRQTTNQKIKQSIKYNMKRGYRFAFNTAKKIGPINRLLSPTAAKLLYKRNVNRFGQWFIDQLIKINSIENQIYPTEIEIATLQYHPLTLDPFHNQFGVIYQNICHQMSDDHIDYLFLAPAMSGLGGTEKLIANYIRAIKENHPDWKIGILSTVPFNNLSMQYFKDLDVDMLDFGKFTQGIGEYEKDIVWSRILVQAKIRRLHIVNDDYWYRWLLRHKKLIEDNNFIVNVSLFMREYTHEKDRILTFADPHISENYSSINNIFTDNQKVVDEALENNAFEPKKFAVHYQPHDFSGMVKPKKGINKHKVRILWASRISFQKRPDILKKIAEGLGNNFEVDAFGIIEQQQYKPDYFNDSRVKYKGIFRGISSINTNNYDIYLYTSNTDGVPNILLEVINAGIPIVASRAGGIGEVIIDNETGKIVDIEDIQGYVDAIKYMVENPDLAEKMAKNAQLRVKKQHSWDNFIKEVGRDIK